MRQSAWSMEGEKAAIGLRWMGVRGYFEAQLLGFRHLPDRLLAHGIAEEVADDWRDKKYPIGTQQYVVTINNFDKEYGELFKQYPVPMGMDWAPIMDAYRAKQPRTDLEPVN
ncbi:hypothetical protein D3C72_1254830 [compost metagenome]